MSIFELPRTMRLAMAAVFCAGGVLLLAFAVCFGLMPRALNAVPLSTLWAWGAGAAGVLISLPLGYRYFREQHATVEEPERSKILYGIHLVGLGFALVLAALICSIAFAAVAWSVGQTRSGKSVAPGVPPALQTDEWSGKDAEGAEAVQETLTEKFGLLFGNSAEDAYFTVALFMLSTGVSLLGALFFFATSLWSKMGSPEREPFDRSLFWGGLWFRLGEAVLFNLVFFLLLRTYAPERYLVLPLVSLLVGMFLKAGETLISGIATRVFAAFEALVPASLAPKVEARVVILDLSPVQDQVFKTIAEQIRALAGVLKVIENPANHQLGVEYDPLKIAPTRIVQEATLRGIEARIVG
jgi:hypothetical protein